MPSRSSARPRARRELAQNFLVDSRLAHRVIAAVDLPEPTDVLELGAGGGAITGPLVRAGHRVTAFEIDPQWTARLRRRCPEARIVRGDMLDLRFPRSCRAVLGNLPYSRTTAILRRLLAEPSWSRAALLVQWEVARKRANGATLLNASWAPWYEFHLRGRVPAHAFRPVPVVDGGILRIDRRARPLLATAETAAYQRFVQAVFTGRGRGLAGILRNITGNRTAALPRSLSQALPKDLSTDDWVWLYEHRTGGRPG